MIILGAADTISGKAAASTALTVTMFGVEITSGVEMFKRLYQGQPTSSAATLYTVPASTQTLIKTITVANPTGVARTIEFWVAGTADANAILPPVTVDAGGYAVYNNDSWKFYTIEGASKVSYAPVASSGLTGTVLAANVVTSSLTTIGTLVAGAVPAQLITPGTGTFGAGAYTFPAALAITGALSGVTTLDTTGVAGFGVASVSRIALRVGGTITASSASARAGSFTSALVAAANNDVLSGIVIDVSRTPGAFTGLLAQGLSIEAFTVAGFTSPADPIGLNIGVVTGTGATNAYGLKVAAPTGAGTLNLSIWALGGMKVGSLAGTGSRTVVADANGVLSAP